MNKFLKSLVTGFVAVAMILSLGGFAGSAQAQTVEELTAQLNSLLALVAQLQAQLGNVQGGTPTTGTGCYPFSASLTIGSRGADVTALQNYLTGTGHFTYSGGSTGYFGEITRAAVAAWQAANGVAPAAGYFGPISMAKYQSICTPVNPTNPTDPTDPTTPVPGNGLTITRVGSGDLLAIPFNVSNMSFGDFVFQAGPNGATITGLTVGRSGAGSKDNFKRVFVTVDGAQRGGYRSILTGDIAEFNFTSDPIVLPPFGSARVGIMASLDSSVLATQTVYNTLGIKALQTTGNIATTLPVWGRPTVTSSQSATIVTLTTQGSAKTISVGAVQTEVGRFRIDVDSDSDQSVRVMSIRFENEGTVSNLSDVLANAVLQANGQTISSSFVFDDATDTLIFLFGEDGYVLNDGQTPSLTILADIIGAEVNDTLQFEVDADSDFIAEEVSTGLGVRVKGNDTAAGGTSQPSDPLNDFDLQSYTVETGDVNFSINNASSRTVSPGQNNVVLLDGTLQVDSAVRADGLKVRLQSGTALTTSTPAGLQANFDNFRLKIDGVAIDTVSTLTDVTPLDALTLGSSGDYFNFDSTFQVQPGSHNITVEANVKSGATANDKLKLAIFSADIDSLEYIVSGDNVPSAELTGLVNGSLITIGQATLTATRNDGFSSETIIGGASDVKVFGFTLGANDASDINVSSLTFSKGTGTYAAGDVNNMRLFVDGFEVGSPTDLSSGSFNDANFSIPRSQQVQADLFADTNTAASALTLRFDLDDIDAFDADGNTATVNHSNGSALSSANALQSDLFTIGTGGSFTLTIDGDTPDEAILVGNDSTWYPVATFRLTAQDEDLKLTDLFLVNATSTGSVLPTTLFSDDRIPSLGVFDENGVLKAQKSLTNGSVRFEFGETVNPNGFGPVIVPMDDFTKISVRARVKSITDAKDTGRLLRLVVDSATSTVSTGGTGVIVQSTATGDDLASTSITAARNADNGPGNGSLRATSTASDFFAMRRSQPTLTIVPQASSENTLTNGSNRVIFRFNVKADANEDVAWKGVKFDVRGRFGGADLATTTGAKTYSTGSAGTSNGFATTTSGTTRVNGFRLYEVGNNQEVQGGSYTVQVDWDATDNNGEIAIVINDGKEEVVSSSASSGKSYELRATIAGATADGDYIDIAIDNEADDTATAGYLVAHSDPEEVDGGADGSGINMTASQATNPYSFLWSDYSGSPHSLNTDNDVLNQRDWTNDRFINLDSLSWNRIGNFN